MADTHRPRGGFTATLAENSVRAIQVPGYARSAVVVFTKTPGRVLVGTASSAPALSGTNYGYAVANDQFKVTFYQGRDTYLYVSSNVADNDVYVTWVN